MTTTLVQMERIEKQLADLQALYKCSPHLLELTTAKQEESLRSSWKDDDAALLPPPNHYSEEVDELQPMLPLVRPGMHPYRLADLFARSVIKSPMIWVYSCNCTSFPVEINLSELFQADLAESRNFYGMEIEAKRFDQDMKIRWSGEFIRRIDERVMTFSQRILEDQISDCRTSIMRVTASLEESSKGLCETPIGSKDPRPRSVSKMTRLDFLKFVADPVDRLLRSVLLFNELSTAFYAIPNRWYLPEDYSITV